MYMIIGRQVLSTLVLLEFYDLVFEKKNEDRLANSVLPFDCLVELALCHIFRRADRLLGMQAQALALSMRFVCRGRDTALLRASSRICKRTKWLMNEKKVEYIYS